MISMVQRTVLLLIVSVSLTYCCIFPERLQGSTWYTNIRSDTRLSVYFRKDIMEFQQENTELHYISDEWERKCEMMIDINKYIVSYENGTFKCLVFINRSDSVMQLRESEVSSNYSLALCDDKKLTTNNWLMVSFENANKEFTVCPFTGGYNMKVKDKDQVDHPCNFVDLPMRFESECLTGEGVTFDFRTRNCIGYMPMKEHQTALCVTSWRQDGDVLIVLRIPESDRIWCLRIPARKSYDGRTYMYLFTDLTCEKAPDVNYFTLELELSSQHSLCVDEHDNCEMLPCTPYFESQCLKSCGKCSPNIYPASCDFPKKLRGEWITNDALGTASLNVTETKLFYDRLGVFNCITFPDSPPVRRTKQYTTVSFFNNGCRPRYTCFSFTKMHSDVYGIAISHSKVWPLTTGHDNVWSEICNSDNFHGDPSPLKDTFRTYNDAHKPIVSITNPVTAHVCPVTASYLFNATFTSGSTCAGALYRHCHQASLLRFQFEKCPDVNYSFYDFVCIGQIDSKYWEQIILIQNKFNAHDLRCLIMSSVEPGRFIVLPSGECDQFTWTYVNVGLRKATMDLIITPESRWCRTITTSAPSTVSSRQFVSSLRDTQPIQDAFKSDTDQDIEQMTHKHRHHKEGYRTSTLIPYKVENKETELTGSQSRSASNSAMLSLCHFHFSVICISLLYVLSLSFH